MSFGMAYAMKKRQKKACDGGKMSEGGEVENEAPNAAENYAGFEEEHPEMQSAKMPSDVSADLKKYEKLPSGESTLMGPGYAHGGLVDRIMANKYSEGGMVANDTGNGDEADEEPNQFDDVVLDDTQSAEQPEDSNMKGNEAEMADRQDIVSRIMRSWEKKDKLPRPA